MSKKCQLRKLQNQILFSYVELKRDASEAGLVNRRCFAQQKTERQMLMLPDTDAGIIGDYRCIKRQTVQSNEKISKIWGSGSCHHFMKTMLYVSNEKEVT